MMSPLKCKALPILLPEMIRLLLLPAWVQRVLQSAADGPGAVLIGAETQDFRTKHPQSHVPVPTVT